MQNFSQQCIDLARVILGQSLPFVSENGNIIPVEEESLLSDDSSYAAFSIGEYYHCTQEIWLGDFQLPKLAAQCIHSQVHVASKDDIALSYASLALLCFGATHSRNPLWQCLDQETQELLAAQILHHRHTHPITISQIMRSIIGFNMGFSKKDETLQLVEAFLGNISKNMAGGFIDNAPNEGIGGCYDIIGLWTLNFIHQLMRMHIDSDICKHFLPSVRTYSERYLRLLPELVRKDGLAWAYGELTGFYAQLYALNAAILALSEGWISNDRQSLYVNLIRRLFHYFFLHYVDQGHGTIVIRDQERTVPSIFSTRRANFDAVRYLCWWATLVKKISLPLDNTSFEEKTGGRFVQFDNTPKKEQGLFIYHSAVQETHYSLPLISGGGRGLCGSLAFPHCPGVFDAPVDIYLPVLQPELTINGQLFIPSFYGKNCATGMGLKRSFFFRYEQPELISHQELVVPDLAHCRVAWVFAEDSITSEFIYTVRDRLKVDQVRYIIALSVPHSVHSSHSLVLGEESLRAVVEKDDFGMTWKELVTVADDLAYRTPYGHIRFLQILSRTNPIFLLPGKPYHLKISFHPDVVHS